MSVKAPIWDLPIRLYHWTLTGLIAFSWWSAENDHLDWHIYSGFAICTLLLFRLFWGFFGSSTARFANFVRGPSSVRAFLKDSASWTRAGHTPLGALSVAAMLGAIAIQVGLGMFAQDDDGDILGPLSKFISSDTSDRLSEIHKIWFYVVLALVAMHAVAILYYKFVLGQPLTKAMITGTGEVGTGTEPMRRGKWWIALLCLLAGLAITRWMVAGLPPF